MKLLRTIAAGMLSIVATTVLIAADYTVAGQFITIPVQQPQSDGAKIVYPCAGYVREPVA